MFDPQGGGPSNCVHELDAQKKKKKVWGTHFSWDTISTHTLSIIGWGVGPIQSARYPMINESPITSQTKMLEKPWMVRLKNEELLPALSGLHVIY